MSEALASYAAPLEAALKEADAQGDQLVLDLENMAAERNALAAEIEAEREGRLALRTELGARDDETFPAFVRRLAEEREQWRDAHASAEAVNDDMIASFRRAVEEALDGPCGETIEEGIARLGGHVGLADLLTTWRAEPGDGVLGPWERVGTFSEGVRVAKAHVGRIIDDCVRGGYIGASASADPDVLRSEDRVVERVLHGVADLLAVAMNASGQGQAATALRGRL